MTFETSRILGGNIHIGKCVLMILGDPAFWVQVTVSFISLAISSIGLSDSTLGTGGREVCRPVISINGTLKRR